MNIIYKMYMLDIRYVKNIICIVFNEKKCICDCMIDICINLAQLYLVKKVVNVLMILIGQKKS